MLKNKEPLTEFKRKTTVIETPHTQISEAKD